MKLSELKGERAVEVLADLIAPITNIARDADNLQLFRNKLQDGETARDAGIRLFKERIPVLIKTHKTDILDIISAVDGRNADEMSLLDIVNNLVDLSNDKEFMSFFLSVVRTEGQTQPAESSANADLSEPES